MKTQNFFRMAFMAVLVSIVMVGCKSSKKMAQSGIQQPTPTSTKALSEEDEIAALEREARLIKARTELEKTKKTAEMELNTVRSANIRVEWVPCMEQGTGISNDVIAGLGIADQQRDRTEALLHANEVAVAEIATRYVGVIKNGLERYKNTGYTDSGARLDESSIEGLAAAIGEKTINKLAQPKCREIAQDNQTGKWIGYVAVHIPLKDAIDETEKELEKAKLSYDKQKFREYLNSEMQKQNQQQREALEAIKKTLEE